MVKGIVAFFQQNQFHAHYDLVEKKKKLTKSGKHLVQTPKLKEKIS
jgi:hypothetical protein